MSLLHYDSPTRIMVDKTDILFKLSEPFYRENPGRLLVLGLPSLLPAIGVTSIPERAIVSLSVPNMAQLLVPLLAQPPPWHLPAASLPGGVDLNCSESFSLVNFPAQEAATWPDS